MEWLWPQTILVSLLYSAVPGAEHFESSINLKERGSAIAVSRFCGSRVVFLDAVNALDAVPAVFGPALVRLCGSEVEDLEQQAKEGAFVFCCVLRKKTVQLVKFIP
jgi:hypothetical protein